MKIKFLLAMVAVFFLLICNSTSAAAQEVALEECYNSVETTNLAYYDPAVGAYVGVPVRCLPWWWDPLYLPFGWTLFTPAILPVAFIDGYYSGGAVSFTNVRIMNPQFLRYSSHFRGLRGDFHNRFGGKFHEARRDARNRWGNDLRKPPPNFKHSGTQHGSSSPMKNKPETGKKGMVNKNVAPAPQKTGPPSPRTGPPPPKAGPGIKQGPPPPQGVHKAPPPPPAGMGGRPGIGQHQQGGQLYQDDGGCWIYSRPDNDWLKWVGGQWIEGE